MDNQILGKLVNEYLSQPPEGIVYAISGDTVDIQLRRSPTLIKNVPVSGNVSSLQIKQIVSLRWDHGKPTVIAGDRSSSVQVATKIVADDDSIENSAVGIRVKAGGIRPWHLSFRPSIEGHTHLDILQQTGWMVDADGTVSTHGTIFGKGYMTLGDGEEIVRIDANNETHRLWAGASDPNDANFSVTKTGDLLAKSGSIAGWDILSDRLSKNGAELLASGELTLGTGENKATLSGVNETWRLWVGASDPLEAPFRVTQAGKVYLEDAVINSDLQSGNYSSGSSGWKIDINGKAEFNDVTIRGAIQSVVFSQSTTSVMTSRFIVTDGGVLISDVGNTDTTVDVDTGLFAIGDIVNLQPATNRTEWMLIVSAPTTLPNGYRYTVQRNLSGSGAITFKAGEAIYSKGSSIYPENSLMIGEYYELGSYDLSLFSSSNTDAGLGGFLTLEGSRAWGPYFGVARRFGPVYNQISDVLRIGRLTGFLGMTGNSYGFSVGDVNRSMTYTEDGLSIVTASGATRIDDDGILTSAMGIASSTTPDYLESVGRLYINPTTKELRIRYKSGTSYKDTLLATLI